LLLRRSSYASATPRCRAWCILSTVKEIGRVDFAGCPRMPRASGMRSGASCSPVRRPRAEQPGCTQAAGIRAGAGPPVAQVVAGLGPPFILTRR
jgi:hypothetical protein